MPPVTTPLREADIRPDELRAGQEAAFAEDIRRLMARRNEFIRVGCPACDNDDATPRFRKFDMHFVECRRCRTIYANPRPTPALLAEYYTTSQNYAYFSRHIFPASEEHRRTGILRPRVRRLRTLLERHGGAHRTLLEVGAGFGTFQQELRDAGLFERVIAVEPTPDLAETCRRRGLEVIEAPIEQVSHETLRVDVVAAFEVLEHLFDPRAFVTGCARFLNPGGMLILTCPNGRGFDIELLGPISESVDVEHLNLLNPPALQVLLESCGLEALEITTPGQLDAELVRKQTLIGRFDLRNQPFLRRVLLDEWEQVGPAFQEFLAAAGLSSHMWAAARRPH